MEDFWNGKIPVFLTKLNLSDFTWVKSANPESRILKPKIDRLTQKQDHFAPVPSRWAAGGAKARAGGMSPHHCPPSKLLPQSLLHLSALLLLFVKDE